MTFAGIVYSLAALVIVYAFIQPRVSVYRETRGIFHQEYQDLTTLLDRHLSQVRTYDGYQGKTKMEIYRLIEKLEDIRSTAEIEKKKSWKRSQADERIMQMNKLLKKEKSAMDEFDKFKQKEVKIFDYLNELEVKIFEGDTSVKDKYDMLSRIYGEDIIKAYDFMRQAEN